MKNAAFHPLLPAEADAIVLRLLTTPISIEKLSRELNMSRTSVQKLYRSRTTAQQREQARRLKTYGDLPARAVERDAQAIVQRLLTSDSIKQICAEYGAGPSVVCRVYSQHTTAQQREAARIKKFKRHPDIRKSFFRKGSEPWNKGIKGVSYPGCQATQFKPGCIRGSAARRYRPLGTIQTRVDKRGVESRFIKIKDDGRPQDRWIPLARWVWSQANGPIPKGHRIVHRDLNPLNDELDNLLCLSGREAVAWQRQTIPGMEARRRSASSKASIKRWQQYRVVTSAISELKPQPLPQERLYSCTACGFESTRLPSHQRCPKCAATTWEQIHRPIASQKPISRVEAFLRRLDAEVAQ